MIVQPPLPLVAGVGLGRTWGLRPVVPIGKEYPEENIVAKQLGVLVDILSNKNGNC